MELERGLKPRGEKNLFPQKKKKNQHQQTFVFSKNFLMNKFLGISLVIRIPSKKLAQNFNHSMIQVPVQIQ